MNTLHDRIRGSLVGGAIGDALGFPVEFTNSFKEIQQRYGERGITRLDTKQFLWDEKGRVDKAVVSDDTQMTLFTANGLLNAKQMGMPGTVGISRAYIEWYLTQRGLKSSKFNECWITRVPALNVRRAPGNTCMSALDTIYRGKEPKNNSKGCGGVMRVAPIPLYATVNERISIEASDRLAGDAAKITHQHPLGFISAALMAHVIYRLALDEAPTRSSFEAYIHEGLEKMCELYPRFADEVLEQKGLVELAISLTRNTQNDVENIEQIGGGWVGDEALAIAFYCSLKYFDNFEGAMIAAVNHAGDSDSTGAVTGNILGAALGYDAIPQFFKEDLEMHDLILHMADDLYRGEITKMEDQNQLGAHFEELVFPRKPIRNSYQVMDRVYAGEYPRDLDEAKSIEKIKQFGRFGITHFIDLTEEGELHPYSQMLHPKMFQIRFPIRDVSVPESTASVKKLIGKILRILKANDENKVYIHCRGGIGRTGVIVGCLLSQQYDYNYEETMRALTQAFSDCPKSAYRETPETHEQREFIAKYAEEMKQEIHARQALKMWTLGLGDSSKRFAGENPMPKKDSVATKDSWKIQPMGTHVIIPLDEFIPENIMSVIRCGHIPSAMEDHWFMYCDENTIRYYRSWTGMCVFVAEYETVEGGVRIKRLLSARESEKNDFDQDLKDAALFLALLTQEYGGDASKFWKVYFGKNE